MKHMNTPAQKALLGLALSAVVFAACGTRNNSGHQTSTTATKPEDRPLVINEFQRVQGTRYLMAEIIEALSRSSASSFSSPGNRTSRNLVFLDGESLASHKLFDTSAYVILDTTPFPSHDHENENEAALPHDPIVTQWLVYQVVKEDTDRDGQLDFSDRQAIGVTDAGGTGYVEILSGLDHVLGMTMVHAGQLVVVYSKGGSKSASVIDLDKRAVVSTKNLTDLGPDVR